MLIILEGVYNLQQRMDIADMLRASDDSPGSPWLLRKERLDQMSKALNAIIEDDETTFRKHDHLVHYLESYHVEANEGGSKRKRPTTRYNEITNTKKKLKATKMKPKSKLVSSTERQWSIVESGNDPWFV